MDSFKIYSQSDVLALTNHRNGEVKLGERVQTYRHCESLSRDFGKGNDSLPRLLGEAISLEGLRQSDCKFVLLGIPEDIGVRANLGIGGAKTAWNAALKAILNTQSNPFLNGNEILVLGHFEIDEPTDTSLQGLRNKTNEIDALVYPVIEKIVRAGKIPIVIGGGHNNALPIISGVSIALNQAINVINIDAHADLRDTAEGRHSGNGFSYAMQHGFLNQYLIFGLHQNYVNQTLPAYISASKTIEAFYFEDLLLSPKSIEENWNEFVADLQEPLGLEIDLDSIENVLSSAITSSGFALNDIRT
ncbi:MAG: arginase, partial [Pedobacter sp.]